MSLVTRVQKDVGEYEEKVFAGLSTRKIACWGAAGALAIAEEACGVAVLGLDSDNMLLDLVVIATLAAGFALGHLKPLHMPVEKALPLIIRQRFGTTKIRYKSSVALSREETTNEGRNDVRKNKRHADEKEYRRLTGYRRERSPEYLFPRYWGLGIAQADEARAEAHDEGALRA